MARSLTITKEENATTSPLLTGFLLLAVAWLLASALFGAPADAAVVASEAALLP